MPHLIYKNVNRKEFINTSLKAAGLVLLPSYAYSKVALNKPGEVHFALLSDTHIPADVENVYRGFYPFQNLKKIVPDVLKANPEAVLINGDVARLTGEIEDYHNVQQLIAPLSEKLPVYMTMGNHDNRDHVKEVFNLKRDFDKKQVMVVETEPVRFLLLDSLLYVDKVAGLLGKEQREWLETFLNKSDNKPTIIFLHHTLGDRDSDLLDVDRLFAIIKPHMKVKAIFYGHSHEYKYDTLEGIHLVNQPAVGYNFSDDQPVGWLNALFTKGGVDLTLQAFDGNTQQNGQTTSLKWRT
jgi:3',5'-cyclic AMP phosphodiesterase CpdA